MRRIQANSLRKAKETTADKLLKSQRRPMTAGRQRPIPAEDGECIDTFLTGGNSDRVRPAADRGGPMSYAHRQGAALNSRPTRYFTASAAASPLNCSGSKSRGDSSTRHQRTYFRGEGGIDGSLTGGMGAAVPLAFEMAVRSGQLKDDKYYAYLKAQNNDKEFTRQQRIQQAARPTPKHARSRFDPILDRGVSPENVLLSAEAEAEYANSKLALDKNKGSTDIKALIAEANKAWEELAGLSDDANVQRLLQDGSEMKTNNKEEDSQIREEGEKHEEDDASASRQEQKILLSPFGETIIPSIKSQAYGGRQGEYAYMKEYKMVHAPTYAAQSLSPIALASQRTERALLDVTMSPMTIANKRRVLAQLCEGAFSKGLMLRASTCETVIGFLAQTTRADRVAAAKVLAALPAGSTAASLSPSASSEQGEMGRSKRIDDLSLRIAIPNPSHTLITSLYYHLKGTHTAPSPLIMENVMRVLHQAVLALPTTMDGRVGSSELEGAGSANTKRLDSGSAFQKRSKEAYAIYNMAQRIMLDSDKYFVLPTRTTLTHYFSLCSHFGDMDAAVRRLVDVQDALAITPNSQMFEAILRGLVKSGLIDEAVGLLGRISEVQMSVQLLNASLEVLLLSRDPKACFAAYSSIQNVDGARSRAIIPNADTFSLLLLACEKMDDWSDAPKLLQHMQQYRVKGDANCLNLMLKGLLKNSLHAFAVQLHKTMLYKKVLVWPALHEAVLEVDKTRSFALASRAYYPTACTSTANTINNSNSADGNGEEDQSTGAGTGGAAKSNVLLRDISTKGYDSMMARINDGANGEEDADTEEAGEEHDYHERFPQNRCGAEENVRGTRSSSHTDNDNDGRRRVTNVSQSQSHTKKDPLAGVGGRRDDFVVASTDDDDAIDLTNAFGDAFSNIGNSEERGSNSSKLSSSSPTLPPSSDDTNKAAKTEDVGTQHTLTSDETRTRNLYDTSDPSTVLAETPFWDIDDDGELSALGIDEEGEAGDENESEGAFGSDAHTHDRVSGDNNIFGEGGRDEDMHGNDERKVVQQRTKGALGTTGGSRTFPPRSSMFDALRRRNPRLFVVPRSQHHMEELLRRRRGHTIDPSYLLEFVESRGVVLSHDQMRSPTTLLRKAHKIVFGTTGMRHGDRLAAAFSGAKGRSARDGESGKLRVPRSQMDAIAKAMFE